MAFNTRFATDERAPYLGVALMLLAAAFGAIDSVIVRQLSPGVHPFVMGFFRALFGMLVVLPWVLRRPEVMRSNYRFRHVLRAALKLAALVAYFYAFARAPLADVTAIAFTAPIFLTVGAWIFLSETPHGLRIAGMVLGFVGVLLVLRPGESGGPPPGLMFAFLGAVLTAVIQLILKPMTGRDSTNTLVAWNLIATVPIAAIPAALVWSTPTPSELALLALQGAIGAGAMASITRAFALADASLIAPLDFLRLPFVAVLAYLFFAQTVPTTTWIGGAVIFAATMLIGRSARRKRPIDL